MHSSLVAALFTGCLLLAGGASAQSPLTTTFANNNSGAVGGAVYFDVNVTAPGGIVVSGLDVNLISAANTAGTIEVYSCPATRTGNQANVAAWTLISSGAVTAAGPGTPSAVQIAPFPLASGSQGIAFKAVGVAHAYTNGNNVYSNGDLTLTTGEASNAAFGGTILGRTANLRLTYDRTLSTLFNSNLGLSGSNSCVYFDVDVTNPAGITLTALDLNVFAVANTTGTVDVYTCPTSRTGNLSNASAWSLVGTGSITAAGTDLRSRVTLQSPISLSFGTVGVAIRSSLGHRYTNGSGSNQNYSNGDLSISCGESSVAPFGPGINSPRVANVQLLYQVGLSGPQATRSNYGSGCTSQVATFYELFTPSSSFDLGNSALAMTPAGGGYQVAAGGTFVPPSPAATVLALNDDSQVLTPVLSTPFPHQGGTAAQLMVCSNGFVSVATGNGIDWTPSVPAMRDASQTAWWCWHDYNPAITLGGRVKFEEVAGTAYITWDGVWNFQGTTTAAANTFQFQFELATGVVRIVWGQMSTLGNDHLVGYSPGGPSAATNATDLSAALPSGFALPGNDAPLTLNAMQRPIPGNSISLVTGNVHPSTLFGAVIVGLTQFPAGISLAPQMAGCFQYTDGTVTLPLFFGGAANQVTTFTVPNAIGLHIFAQSVSYCPAAGLTVLGAVASGGLDLGIGIY